MRKYDVLYKTVQGQDHIRSGKPNEDSYYIKAVGNLIWAGVFDGISSGGSGNIASRIAANSMSVIVESQIHNMDIPMVCSLVFKKAQEQIISGQNDDPDNKKMGTTASLACLDRNNNKLYWFSIGDSAIFLCGRKKQMIHKLTTEDSKLGYMVARGEITQAMTIRYAAGHELERWLGMPVESDKIMQYVRGGSIKLNSGDNILVCSDGLYNTIPAKKISRIISHTQNAAENLVELATNNNSMDDITAIVIKEVNEKTKITSHSKVYYSALGVLLFATGFASGVVLSDSLKERWNNSRHIDKRPSMLNYNDSTLLMSTDNNIKIENNENYH